MNTPEDLRVRVHLRGEFLDLNLERVLQVRARVCVCVGVCMCVCVYVYVYVWAKVQIRAGLYLQHEYVCSFATAWP